MSATLGMFVWIFGWGRYLAGEFCGASDVNEDFVFAVQRLSNVIKIRSDFFVRSICLEGGFRVGGCFFRYVFVLCDPFLAAAVHQDYFVDAIVFHYLECEGSEPVVEITVEDQCRVVADPRSTKEIFELLLAQYVLCNWVVHVLQPVKQYSAWNVAEVVVCGGIVVDLRDAYGWILQVILDPIGLNENFRVLVRQYTPQKGLNMTYVILTYLRDTKPDATPIPKSSRNCSPLISPRKVACSQSKFKLAHKSVVQ